jgi:uncharacterized membrane protein
MHQVDEGTRFLNYTVVAEYVMNVKDRLSRYWKSFSFVGLVFATLFFAASVTPSLVPRNYFFQGLLSGLALTVGYALGVCGVWLYHYLEFPEPSEKVQLVTKRISIVVVTLIFIVCLRQLTFWQNSIRELMEMEPLASAYPYRTALIALVFGVSLVAFGRTVLSACAYVSKQLNRVLPRRVSIAVGFVIVSLVLLFLVNGVLVRGLLRAADAFFLQADSMIDEGIEQPKDPLASGSNESLIDWDSIGRRGKNFISGGPTANELGEFWGQRAMQPIRVCVGMRSEDTHALGAKLALEELLRVGAFDRSVLVVATPTGTGWLDPGAVDTIEYLHAGDTAIVTMNYSYLPSWLTILVNPERSIQSARSLFDKIYDYWKMLPAEGRPKLYLHGLSLGSLASEVSANLYAIFEDPHQGAVWSGPPFPSTQWSRITEERNPESPEWLPTFEEGSLVRFTAQKNTLDTGKRWGPIRNVYIQYASDPMVFFSLDLLWKEPQWLKGERGPDVSPHLKWRPIVTFLQIGFDLAMADSVTIGYGHSYSPSSYIDAWIAVTQPKNWNAEKTTRLKKLFSIPSNGDP